MNKSVLILLIFYAFGVAAQNPNVILPEGTYPYWPAYNYLVETDLKNIQPQPWKATEHVIEGWDWSLPGFVKQSPRSSVGLQRNQGWDKEFMKFDLPFPANPVGLLWVKWRDIEKTKDNFDFAPLIIRIKQANSVGTQISLRILCHSKSRGTGSGEAPLWLEGLGVTFLPQKNPGDNLNFDPAHPVFHERYLKLISELAKTEIPKLVKNAYVGYASHSFGDEGIGPFPETQSAQNDTVKHVRERLDAWEKAFNGMETKVYMGAACDYGFKKGFGTRRGFVEMYLYRIPNIDMGQYVDSKGYLRVDENAPIIRYKCFHGEVNEEYESAWAASSRDFRFGNSTVSFPYRYFISTLRALQMQCTYIHTTGHLVPQMLPFLALELGRTVEDAPDVWSFLNTFWLKTGDYSSNDWQTPKRTIIQAEKDGGIETKNFERWLYQRDAPGYETQPAVRIQQAIKMWMVQPDKYLDYIARSGKKIGFDIDNRWVAGKDSVALKVTYFDNHAGELNLIYNNAQTTVQKSQLLNGDGKLKTVTFFISNLKPNSLVNNFDFTLEAGKNTENIVVSMVRVVKATENSGPVSSNRNAYNNTTDIKISYHQSTNQIAVNSRNNIRQIEMYDIFGKKVRSVKGSGTVVELHTSGLKPGVYLVHVNDTSGNKRREKIAIV
jgi:hypothetical protein